MSHAQLMPVHQPAFFLLVQGLYHLTERLWFPFYVSCRCGLKQICAFSADLHRFRKTHWQLFLVNSFALVILVDSGDLRDNWLCLVLNDMDQSSPAHLFCSQLTGIFSLRDLAYSYASSLNFANDKPWKILQLVIRWFASSFSCSFVKKCFFLWFSSLWYFHQSI